MGRGRLGVGMEKKKKVGGGQEIGPFKWERCFLKKKKERKKKIRESTFNWLEDIVGNMHKSINFMHEMEIIFLEMHSL